MAQSKYQIHSELRRIFARRWIDMERIRFGAHRGIVRVSGELHYTRVDGWDVSVSIIDLLQQEIIRIRGVTRVFFDVVNWERDERGKWAQRELRKKDDADDPNKPKVFTQSAGGSAGEDDAGGAGSDGEGTG